MKYPAFVLLILLLTSGSAFSQDDSLDTQFWNETQVIFPVIKKKDESGKATEKLSFFINGNLRANQGLARFIDQRAGFGFIYRHNKYVSITPSYIYIAQKPLSRVNTYESRLRFAVNLENKWKTFSIDDRNLIEYRIRNSATDSVRYRNRLKFAYPIIRGDKEVIAPYASNEVFYDFQAKELSRNELSLGVTRKLNLNVSADFFYIWQANRSGSLKHANIFGINVKIKID
jgi:hypothetical protein